MPEGDTLKKTAMRLTEAIAGATLTGYTARSPKAAAGDLVGHRIEAVEARGKNLLIRFDDGRVLYSHLVMRGSWHIYRPGERWQLARGRAALVLETEGMLAVCFDTERVELLSARAAERYPALASLGPDLLAEDFDVAAALERYREVSDLTIGEAVMIQRLAAGIGNIYKSESLFEAKVSPFEKVGVLGDEGVARVLQAAQALLSASVDRAKVKMARTRGARMMVYGRSGEPCYVCGAEIRMERQGDLGRSTYWCPECQPLAKE
ncbi:MAG: DNA-formamidopyrimidine glycosylase family protein [Myxococcota bacterium]